MRRVRSSACTASWRSARTSAPSWSPAGRLPRPPANVDTIAAHSWLLAALAGNANVVRLAPSTRRPPRSSSTPSATALGDHPGIAATTSFVTYGHEVDISAALSTADVRVVWGGDDTVRRCARSPDRPGRSVSASPIAPRWPCSARGGGRPRRRRPRGLAERIANDVLWFDQLACSSPRLVVWSATRTTPAAAGAGSTPRLRDRHPAGHVASTSNRLASCARRRRRRRRAPSRPSTGARPASPSPSWSSRCSRGTGRAAGCSTTSTSTTSRS